MSVFGEISEPSTRTAWEDWDDVAQENYPDLCLHKKVQVPMDIEIFLILEGRYLYECVKAQHDTLEHINSIPEVNLHLYKAKTTNNYICAIKDYNLVQSSEIVELLKEYITKSVEVIGLLTKPLVEYHVADLITTDIVIRSICTGDQPSKCLKTSYPKLEQPNIISGVAAGALCLREIIDKPATVLVCYIEHPEEQQFEQLQELLKKFKIITDIDKVNRNNVLNSNLYI